MSGPADIDEECLFIIVSYIPTFLTTCTPQEAKCPVPFCLNIKQKLRQQQLQQRLQEAAMMRRRMAQMNARMNPGGIGGSVSSQGKGGSVSAAPAHPPMTSTTTMNHMNNSGKPGGSAQPNQNVLEAVKKVS